MLELLVALTLLGVLLLVARMALPQSHDIEGQARRAILQARREALRSGRPVTSVVIWQGQPTYYTAHPDGRVLTAVRSDGAVTASGAADAR